jgi:hypothetical protein
LRSVVNTSTTWSTYVPIFAAMLSSMS